MILNEPNTIYFVSKLQVPSTVNLVIRRPDKNNEGLYSMVEFDPITHPFVYEFDYTPSLEGTYLFTIFENGVHTSSKALYCELGPQSKVPTINFED